MIKTILTITLSSLLIIGCITNEQYSSEDIDDQIAKVSSSSTKTPSSSSQTLKDTLSSSSTLDSLISSFNSSSSHLPSITGKYYDVPKTFARNDTTFHAGLCYSEDVYSYETYEYKPIYQPMNEFLSEIKNMAEQPLVNPGKIYQFENYKFIAEKGKGVHVYDNSSPTNPTYLTFLNIPGNEDIAIQGNALYADIYGALLTLDISDMQNVTVSQILPEAISVLYGFRGYSKLTEEGFLLEVVVDRIITHLDCYDPYYYDDYLMSSEFEELSSSDDEEESSSSEEIASGEAGSLARFAINKGYLYIINHTYLLTFDLSDNLKPNSVSSVYAISNSETIFIESDLLFIGSQRAMLIFDINTPDQPVKASTFRHATSCDPVVVQDQYAYVTLRSGTWCRNGNNQLEIIDISNIYDPTLAKTIQLEGPNGLGVHDTELYVSDASNGLLVYDITNTPEIEQINQIDSILVNDVIVNDDNLTLIGSEGMYQYDHSDPFNLILQSYIPAQ